MELNNGFRVPSARLEAPALAKLGPLLRGLPSKADAKEWAVLPKGGWSEQSSGRSHTQWALLAKNRVDGLEGAIVNSPLVAAASLPEASGLREQLNAVVDGIWAVLKGNMGFYGTNEFGAVTAKRSRDPRLVDAQQRLVELKKILTLTKKVDSQTLFYALEQAVRDIPVLTTKWFRQNWVDEEEPDYVKAARQRGDPADDTVSKWVAGRGTRETDAAREQTEAEMGALELVKARLAMVKAERAAESAAERERERAAKKQKELAAIAAAEEEAAVQLAMDRAAEEARANLRAKRAQPAEAPLIDFGESGTTKQAVAGLLGSAVGQDLMDLMS